jgi:hypothetical protein
MCLQEPQLHTRNPLSLPSPPELSHLHSTTASKQIPNAPPQSGSVQPRLAAGPFRSAAKSYSLSGISLGPQWGSNPEVRPVVKMDNLVSVNKQCIERFFWKVVYPDGPESACLYGFEYYERIVRFSWAPLYAPPRTRDLCPIIGFREWYLLHRFADNVSLEVRRACEP